MIKKKLDKSPIRLPKALVGKAKAKYVVLIPVLLAVLLIPTTVFFTLAYKTDTTGEITNKFDPKEVVIKINEDFNKIIKKDVAITNTGEVDAYVRFKITISAIDNEGNVIALPISKINTSNTVADLTYRGIDISDFTINDFDEDTSTDWTDNFLVIDGIYYYTSILPVEETIDIFDSAVFNIPVFDPEVIDLPLPLIDDDGNPYYVVDAAGNLCYQYNEITGEYTAYTKDEIKTAGYTLLLDDDGTFTYMLSSYTPVLTIVAESIQAEGVTDAWGLYIDENGKLTINLNSTEATALTIDNTDTNDAYSGNPSVTVTETESE